LAVGHVADLGGCSRRHIRQARLAGGPFGFPVSAGALDGTLPALFDAEPRWPREVSYPEGDRTLGDAESGHDLVVVESEVPEAARRRPQFVFRIGATRPVGRGDSSQ